VTWGYDKIQGALANLGHSPGSLWGCTTNPTEPWMKQIARNLTDCEDGFLNGKRFLIMDRDTKFTDGFFEILKCQGVEAVKLPPRSPDLNPHIERFIRSIKDESLSRLILFGENMLSNAVRQFLTHYHTERNHQSLDNKIIQPGDEVGQHEGDVQSRERLGGMLRYYYREAA
jgi:putative transposase